MAGRAPDATLAYADARACCPVARVDGRFLSTEVAAGFTGRVVGVRAIDGPVTVRQFDYREGVDILSDVPA